MSAYPIKFYFELFWGELDGAQNAKPAITRHRSDYIATMAKSKQRELDIECLG